VTDRHRASHVRSRDTGPSGAGWRMWQPPTRASDADHADAHDRGETRRRRGTSRCGSATAVRQCRVMMIGLAPLSNLGSVIASCAESAARPGAAEARRNLDVTVGPDEHQHSGGARSDCCIAPSVRKSIPQIGRIMGPRRRSARRTSSGGPDDRLLAQNDILGRQQTGDLRMTQRPLMEAAVSGTTGPLLLPPTSKRGRLGAARLLSLSRLLGPGYRNTTRRIRRLGLAGRDAYADLAIVWVLTVVRRCGLRLGRRCRVGEGEQIRLQARSVPYDSRLPGVTDSMEH
jgi:hypothetical protein